MRAHRCRYGFAFPVGVPDKFEILGVKLGDFRELRMGDLLSRHPIGCRASARFEIKLGLIGIVDIILRACGQRSVELAH